MVTSVFSQAAKVQWEWPVINDLMGLDDCGSARVTDLAFAVTFLVILPPAV